MRFTVGGFGAFSVGFGGGAMLETRWALLAAGNVAVGSGIGASSLLVSENVGTSLGSLAACTFGVLSESPSSVMSMPGAVTPCSSSGRSSATFWSLLWSRCSLVSDRSHFGKMLDSIFGLVQMMTIAVKTSTTMLV